MSDHPQRDGGEIGEPTREGAPTALTPIAQQTGMLVRAVQEAVQDSVGHLRTEIAQVHVHARSDLKWTMAAFAAGFVLLGGMIFEAYHWVDGHVGTSVTRLEDKISKTDDKVDALGISQARIDQKLQDLLDRIPPVPTPPPHH
jgi:hypothetical protein